MNQTFIEDNLIILSKQTIDVFLKQEQPADCIALYSFYYYTAKWQKTNQIKSTTDYVSKGLKWSEEKVIKTKDILKKLNLIEDIQTKNKGKITGWYIKINYLWKKDNVSKNQGVDVPEGGFNQRVEKQGTNALSANSLNALSANKQNIYITHVFLNDSNFKQEWDNFLQSRRVSSKRPATQRAEELLLKKLDKLSGGDIALATKIVEQSIMGGWIGLFPLKEEPLELTPEQKEEALAWEMVRKYGRGDRAMMRFCDAITPRFGTVSQEEYRKANDEANITVLRYQHILGF